MILKLKLNNYYPKCLLFPSTITYLILSFKILSSSSLPLHARSVLQKNNLTSNDKDIEKNHIELKNVTLTIFSGKLLPDLIHPPDHLGAVRMERDGHLNRSFRKEVLLGSSTINNSNKNISSTKENELLRQIFYKADLDSDGLLSSEELEHWIAAKVRDHFQQAVKENFMLFTELDKNHDGTISWDEYHVNFLIEKGLGEKYAKKHERDHKTLDRKTKEKILLDKAAWSEAANSDPEALNIDEFLTFRHPEHSHVSLLNMVNDIISSLDMNGDEELTEEEFANKTPDDENESNTNWKKERIREFREVIDMDKDQKVSKQELLMYNDPENPILAKKEARDLIRLADSNGDKFLSLKEILDKKDTFLGSKMVDTAKSFHDEF